MSDYNSKVLKVVGTRPVRPDGADKVTGRAIFGADFKVAGMLIGRIKRSPHAHARIVSIDTRKARALPGVKAVITGADMPQVNADASAGGESAMNMEHVGRNCMARDKALYAGHAVAAVAATSAEIAEAALDLIEVTYEVLPHVVDVEAAMASDAPVLHDDLFTAGLETTPDKPSNVAMRLQSKRGDAAAAIAAADVVIEGRYTTQPVHQGYIEPHACVASVSADGQAVIWCSSQGAFMVRSCCSAIMNMNAADIRVVPLEIGGGFGGKTTVYLEPVALALSKRCGRPVKMVMDRNEVFIASGPTSGAVMDIRIGAGRDGRIAGVELDIKVMAGAFPGSPMPLTLMTAVTPYDLANFTMTGYDVVTNTPKVAAYRAPGAPIAAFAVEGVIDELALKLGMDPVDIRALNGVRDGAKAPYGVTFKNIVFQETLAAAKAHPHYSAPLGPNQGRGLAAGFWFNIGMDSSVTGAVNEDGSVVIATGNPDIGGSRASMSMMAAEVLGIPLAKVRPFVADTASVGFNVVTAGSRTTFATGMAVTQAAEKLVEEMRGRAAKMLGASLEQIEWREGTAVCTAGEKQGSVLSIGEIAAKSGHTGGPITTEVSLCAQGAAPTFGVHICDVEVDRETGNVTVLRYTAVQDVGRAIHPSYVEGQLQGGATQGIGWALNEEYVYDSQGRMENPGFLDYRIPVASDLPMIDTVLVEVPNPTHPFGVKGVGEVPIVPPLATVANAVRAATGHRFQNLPLSPPRIHAALNGAG